MGRNGRLLLRRSPFPGWPKASYADSLDGRPHPVICSGNAGTGTSRALARIQEAPRMVHRESSGPRRQRGLHAHARKSRAEIVVDCWTRPVAARVAVDARRERVSFAIRDSGAVAISQGSSIYARGERNGISRELRTRGIEQRIVRRKFQLARTDL